MRDKKKKKQMTHVYRGHTSGTNERIIVASNPNEAYALMLDALAEIPHAREEVYADPERNRYLKAYYKRYPIGAYDITPARNHIKQLKVV